MAAVSPRRFTFRSPNEGRDLAATLSQSCAMPEQVAFGLNELLLNAVEHGNLEISYAEKTKLVIAGTWAAEVQRRLELAEYRARRVVVDVDAVGDQVVFTIKDEGPGFAWEGYLELAAERATDPHGRGIALSMLMAFSSVTYQGRGNEVVCTAALAAAPP